MSHSSVSTAPFSGSYHPHDVELLLKEIPLSVIEDDAMSLRRKEGMIQSGARHYSEIASREQAPADAYISIFESALARHADRMGRDVAALALALEEEVRGKITLASLVRAGVPLGVLLARSLKALGRDVAHFGISIIRDRGIDLVALEEIVARRPREGLVFVDGWTGKGAITRELESDLRRRAPEIEPRLVVLADPAGKAWLAASYEDWLIPSGILGANVSGLVGRSVLNDRFVGPGDYHATAVMENLRSSDVSRRFVDVIHRRALQHLGRAVRARTDPQVRADVSACADAAVSGIARLHAVTNANRIKPGIAEATRAVLRRVPERIFVSDIDDPDLSGLLHLAQKAHVPIDVRPELLGPYRAITLIAKVA